VGWLPRRLGWANAPTCAPTLPRVLPRPHAPTLPRSHAHTLTRVCSNAPTCARVPHNAPTCSGKKSLPRSRASSRCRKSLSRANS
jgi:hypothetical protein